MFQAPQLKQGDLFVCEPGDIIPCRRRDRGWHRQRGRICDHGRISSRHPREWWRSQRRHQRGTKVFSDGIVVRVTQDPGHSFLDRTIALVEGAKRQKTPNEIALSILLAGLTIVFLFATVTLLPFAKYAAGGGGSVPTVTILVALLVCLIPTTIGGLLSAIGIAGMDQVMQHNVLAMSGKAVEAAGRRQHPPAGQDGNDHPGKSPGDGLSPSGRHTAGRIRERRAAGISADETPEGRSIVVLAKEVRHPWSRAE